MEFAMTIEPTEISGWVVAGKSAIDLLRTALSMLPKEADKDIIEEKIKEADLALKKSDVKLAKYLGYKLCECTFPPQIMLWDEQQASHVCPNPKCGRKIERPKPRTAPGATWATSRRWP
jgi:hypothetical protein